MNPVTARLLSQQLICPQFTKPEEVVSWFGAMQGQEYRMVRWAVAMRTKSPSLKAFEKAFNEGRIVRTHLLRCTWQLVAGEDLGWILSVCRTKALSGLRGWMSANKISIPAEEQELISGIFEETLLRQRSARKADFVAALAERGITMDDHRLSYHIRLAELSGLLCSGDLHPMKNTYSLVREKIGNSLNISGENALGMLARKYFRSHSPATFEDFLWWSGLNVSDCQKAVEIIGDELVKETWKGREFYIHESCRTRGFRSGTVHLISPYDEYLIGYKSRDVVLPPEHSRKAHSNNGIFQPVIALDGEIVGNWSPTSKTGCFEIFKDGLSIPEDVLTTQFEIYQRFANLTR